MIPPNKKLLVNAFLYIVICGAFIGCKTNDSGIQIEKCPNIPGLDSLLIPGQIFLLGEIHGTKESPEFVESLVCLALSKNLSVSVALELPQSQEALIRSYCQSKGMNSDKNKILKLPFWSRDYQDGRASQAMFALIEAVRKLKESHKYIEIIPIDNSESNDRDLSMAQRIIQEAKDKPNNLIIVLTGNYHNTVIEDSGQMGSYVLQTLGKKRVLSLNLGYSGGSAWVDIGKEPIGPVRFRGNGRNQTGIFLDNNMIEYHGTFQVDSIHYSRPAKELLENK